MKILLVRHGESIGNVNPIEYTKTFDSFITLTDEGHKQAKLVGHKILEEINPLQKRSQFARNNEIKIIYSPYTRTSDTKNMILEAFEEKNFLIKSVEDSPLLREQEYKFSNQVLDSELLAREHDVFGKFWYRFKNAESIADVYQRQVAFLNDLKIRVMTNELKAYENGYIIIVAHAISIGCLKLILERQTIDKLDTHVGNAQAFLYTFNIRNERQKLIKIL